MEKYYERLATPALFTRRPSGLLAFVFMFACGYLQAQTNVAVSFPVPQTSITLSPGTYSLVVPDGYYSIDITVQAWGGGGAGGADKGGGGGGGGYSTNSYTLSAGTYAGSVVVGSGGSGGVTGNGNSGNNGSPSSYNFSGLVTAGGGAGGFNNGNGGAGGSGATQGGAGGNSGGSAGGGGGGSGPGATAGGNGSGSTGGSAGTPGGGTGGTNGGAGVAATGVGGGGGGAGNGSQTFAAGGDGQVVITITAALPIKLVSFSGAPVSEGIALKWTTASEVNNDYMAVERSVNGLEFAEIGRVKGVGTTTETQNYSFLDTAPAAGANYYRLRQVDLDGAAQHHQVIYVDFAPTSTSLKLEAFPNPAIEKMRVSWPVDGRYEGLLQVFNASGQLLATYRVPGQHATFELPLTNLSAGVYIVSLTQGKQQQAIRFVKK